MIIMKASHTHFNRKMDRQSEGADERTCCNIFNHVNVRLNCCYKNSRTPMCCSTIVVFLRKDEKLAMSLSRFRYPYKSVIGAQYRISVYRSLVNFIMIIRSDAENGS